LAVLFGAGENYKHEIEDKAHEYFHSRTTVSISMSTKSRMDKWRAPGQCYDGFLSQLVKLWERMHRDDIEQKINSRR
jgi:hypothetical protein